MQYITKENSSVWCNSDSFKQQLYTPSSTSLVWLDKSNRKWSMCLCHPVWHRKGIWLNSPITLKKTTKLCLHETTLTWKLSFLRIWAKKYTLRDLIFKLVSAKTHVLKIHLCLWIFAQIGSVFWRQDQKICSWSGWGVHHPQTAYFQ